MRVFHSLDEARGAFAPSALTIGNFDGVHAGHRELVRTVLKLARETGSKPSLLTFDPHPTHVVAPHRAPLLLSTPAERCELLGGLGMEQVLILPFRREVASLTAHHFFENIVAGVLGARAVTVGDNFLFGHKQAGTVDTLRSLCAAQGIRVEIVPAVRDRGAVVSSSKIRELLAEGRVTRAARLLQRPFSLAANVVRGEGIGSQKTVPTLNLDVPALEAMGIALPAQGVYVTRTTDPDTARVWSSVTNAGYRPTFGGTSLAIESFLLTPFDGETPRRIRVEFLRRLREERTFDSAEALKAQILKDVGRALAYFRRLERFVGRERARA